jgi:hypothetical protein
MYSFYSNAMSLEAAATACTSACVEAEFREHLPGACRIFFWRVYEGCHLEPLGDALKIRIRMYVSGIAPSKKLGVCNTANGSSARRNCGVCDRREIKWLPVPGVRKNPFIEATP